MFIQTAGWPPVHRHSWDVCFKPQLLSNGSIWPVLLLIWLAWHSMDGLSPRNANLRLQQVKASPNPLLTQLHRRQSERSISDHKYHWRRTDGVPRAPDPQRTAFTAILATLHQFLTSVEGKSECILVSIKQEDQASPEFTTLVHSAIRSSAGGSAMWFTQSNRIPMLGEVRGRCVLFSRFGEPGQGGLGIHPDRWPDSAREGFDCMCGEAAVRVSDWYFLFLPLLAVMIDANARTL